MDIFTIRVTMLKRLKHILVATIASERAIWTVASLAVAIIVEIELLGGVHLQAVECGP